jgi:hypothetical protein
VGARIIDEISKIRGKDPFFEHINAKFLKTSHEKYILRGETSTPNQTNFIVLKGTAIIRRSALETIKNLFVKGTKRLFSQGYYIGMCGRCFGHFLATWIPLRDKVFLQKAIL